jgi:ribosomal protein S3
MKSVLRGKLTALSVSKRKLERAYTNSLTAQPEALEQKEAKLQKRSRRQEIIQLRAEVNQVEIKITIQRNKPGAGSSRKINKIDKSLARLTRGHRDSILINKIRKENRDITTEPEEIKKIIRSNYKSLY